MPLDQVAQRIAQQQSELQRLRQEYQGRTRRLKKLTRRKQQLQAQLDKIDGRIHALNGAGRAALKLKAAAPVQPRSAKTARRTKKRKSGSLAQLLVTVLREAGKPLSNKELTEEVRRRAFATRASDLSKVVATRVWALVKKGHLQRTSDHKIVAVGGKKSTRSLPTSPAVKSASGKSASKALKGRPSLQAVLTQILQKSDKPLPGSELASRVLATGYKSQSQNFINLIWVTLGRMDNVENTRGQGYRLKKR